MRKINLVFVFSGLLLLAGCSPFTGKKEDAGAPLSPSIRYAQGFRVTALVLRGL